MTVKFTRLFHPDKNVKESHHTQKLCAEIMVYINYFLENEENRR